MPYVSKPMKLVTVWFTEEEKAILDELAKTENVTLSKALRGGAELFGVVGSAAWRRCRSTSRIATRSTSLWRTWLVVFA